MNNNSQKEVFNLESALQSLPLRKKVLVLRLGRGRTGGSTLLDLLTQLARSEGRRTMVCDGDRRNPSLAALYPSDSPDGATQPRSDEVGDVKEWVTNSLGEAVRTDSSLVFDMGAGDLSMQDYARDLNLLDFCATVSMETLGLFFSGPDLDDFEHILSIWKAGYFRPKRSLLIFNEHLVPQGRTPMGAFDAITTRPDFLEMSKAGMETIMMPRLPCLDLMRRSGISFMDATAGRSGKDGKPLDPVRQFMIKQWIAKIQTQLAEIGATEWVP